MKDVLLGQVLLRQNPPITGIRQEATMRIGKSHHPMRQDIQLQEGLPLVDSQHNLPRGSKAHPTSITLGPTVPSCVCCYHHLPQGN